MVDALQRHGASIEMQIEAVRALVLLDDARGDEALDRLGHGYPADGHGYWSLYDARRHRGRRTTAGGRLGQGQDSP
ncbi:hypothetical protein ACIQZO_29290 [Streptomyces sp. NPDC097617]|uniref:hypothetical protein n=1 Tax=Streptomyces sp. NPDC097617 TaxID=3366091 RepID=UPI00380C0C1B